MKRGRKPTPTALKELAGNPGHRPLNTEEPRFNKEIQPCPDWLDEAGQRVWQSLAPQLFTAGVLTQPDQLALAMLCQTYARWQTAEQEVKKSGQVITTMKGNVVQNPYLGIANRAQQQFIKLAAEFGLTPSARARLKAEPPEEKSLADLLFASVSTNDDRPNA